MRRRRWGLILALCVTAMSTVSTGTAAAAGPEGATIAAGRLRGIQWIVEAAPDEGRRGICFGVGYVNPSAPLEVQCSAPAEKRGIVIGVESAHLHSRHGAITVIGMAMNKAVTKVRVKTCAGKVEVRVPKSPRGPGSKLGHIADYRYVAFAVRGPWCVRMITTYDNAGESLFEGPPYDL